MNRVSVEYRANDCSLTYKVRVEIELLTECGTVWLNGGWINVKSVGRSVVVDAQRQWLALAIGNHILSEVRWCCRNKIWLDWRKIFVQGRSWFIESPTLRVIEKVGDYHKTLPAVVRNAVLSLNQKSTIWKCESSLGQATQVAYARNHLNCRAH